MNKNNFIAIMAGGVGSRFWPASTKEKPKQFLDILGVGKSLIRMTFERCIQLVPIENVLIITNERYRDLVKEHLPELSNENILGEPSMNNTGPCVAWTALHLNAKNENAVFAVLPSDHVILKEQQYIKKLAEGFEYASQNNAIVTLGIKPTRPDTGYGYIEYTNNNTSVLKVNSFKEKPDLVTAEKYLEQGNYLWNAGMFIWSVKTILDSFHKNANDILEVLNQNSSAFGKKEEQAYINKVYPTTPNISIDYAILEKATNIYTIPSDIGWSDLGTWNSLHAYMDKDDNSNAILGGPLKLIETKNCIIRSNKPKVIIKGLEDFIVIDEKNALLIYPKSDEQEIKQVVKSQF